MKEKAIIIFGSSRSHGDTRQAINNVFAQLTCQLPLIDLTEYRVAEFRYEHDQEDDFLELIQTALNYELIILATPVYWYSVSAKMKCFIDRLSDLLMSNKTLGRCLRGKKLAVIASYNTYPEGTDGFEKPLQNTANYLGMTFQGTYFYYSGDVAEGIAQSSISLETFISAIG